MRTAVAVLVLLAAPAALAADADGWSGGAGLSYSTGDYGTSRTTRIWSVPFALRYGTRLRRPAHKCGARPLRANRLRLAATAGEAARIASAMP